jgi:hypothetical protein
MEASLEAAVIKPAGEWALHLTNEQNRDKLIDSKELLQQNYLWALKFLKKHASSGGIF